MNFDQSSRTTIGAIERVPLREVWPEIQDAMINAMIRLGQSLRPYLQRLR